MKQLSISILILNWNGKNDTLECLASLQHIAYPNYRIILVDNGSTDGSVEAFEKEYPEITLIKTGANLGYAGGNNVGINYALEHDADYILLLNNDTIVDPDLLNHLVAADQALPDGSVLGPKIYYFDEPKSLWYAGAKWLPDKLHFIHLGSHEIDGPQFNDIRETDYITGCALFARADTFRSVGLLDEAFYLTYEETDWCYRAKASGHQCYFVPEAKIWHKVSSSFGGNQSPLRNYFMTRNRMLWAKRHLSRSLRLKLHRQAVSTIRSILFPAFYLADTERSKLKQFFWSLATWFKTIKRNVSSPSNIAILLGYRDYYLGRFGNCPQKIRSLVNNPDC